MLTGVVNIFVAPFPVAPAPCNAGVIAGDLLLCGDGEGNQVVVTDNGGGSYTITRPANDNTTFRVNGAGIAPAQTVTGITGNFTSQLMGGGDTLTLQDVTLPAVVGNPPLVSSGNLIINASGGGNDTYNLNGTFVPAEIFVGIGPAGGRNTLNIQPSTATNARSTVVGATYVTNTGAGGNEVRVLDSDLRGNGALFAGLPLPPTDLFSAPLPTNGQALQVIDGAGQSKVEVLGNSVIGAGANPPNTGQNAIFINNGAGGSEVTLGPEAAASTKRVQVFGGIQVNNGGNLIGTVDLVTLNSTDVTGGVGIDHLAGPGTAMNTIINSNLGTDLATPGNPPGVPAGGFPVEIVSENGSDGLVVTNSTIPWGLFVNNDAAAGGILPGPGFTGGGSNTSIMNSSIGNRPGGPGSPVRYAGRFPGPGAYGMPGLVAFDAVFVSGDNGNDIVTITALQSLGNVNVNVFNGENSVTVSGANGASALAGLNIIGGTGTDNVTLTNLASPVSTYIQLGFGSDRLTLVGTVTFATSPQTGTLQIWSGTPGTPGAGANDVLDVSGLNSTVPNPGLSDGFDQIIT